MTFKRRVAFKEQRRKVTNLRLLVPLVWFLAIVAAAVVVLVRS
jgi:hypothetical protein